jgi:hypothetical protein
MTVLVDSNILIDLIGMDQQWMGWSRAILDKYNRKTRIVINQIIYSEISAKYKTISVLEDVLRLLPLVREDLPWEAAFFAAKAFKAYRDHGGSRQTPLPDFYIGAHAQVSGYTLITRDTVRYKAYFPELVLIGPEEN